VEGEDGGGSVSRLSGDSTVSILTGYGTDDQEFFPPNYRKGKEFLFSPVSIPAQESTHPPIK